MERRRHPRKAIRLRVRYRSAESLVTEYTTCVSKGGCALVTERAIELGTHFVFEMYAHGQDEPLEIEGQVVRVQPIEAPSPRYEIGVEYVAVGAQREVLDRLLSKILIDPSYESVRRHPRIPVNLIAHGAGHPPRYLVRDMSRGGMRIEGKSISGDVGVGFKAVLTAQLSERGEPFTIMGQVVWVHRGSLLIRTRLGVQFTTLTDTQLMIVDGMTRLMRPRSLALGFRAPTAEIEKVTAAQLMPRQVRSAEETRALIEGFAIKFLEEQPFLALSVSDEEPWPSKGGDFARVGFVGDVDGEFIVQVELEVGAHIASQTLGVEVSSSNHHLIADAITEWVSTLAGFVCDMVDELDVELEVSAPIPGDPVFGTRDRANRVVLRGVYGAVVLTIVTRDVSASAWPI